MSIELSICIPTYNRAELFRQCLSSVLNATAGAVGAFEIVVSDNASEDDTARVAREFCAADSRVSYCRQEQNIGAEQNFRFLAEKAGGRYIWILGDDDLMLPHALTEVLGRIRQGADVVLANYSAWNKDLSNVISERALNISTDRWFEEPDDVMKCLGLRLGYISSIVVKRRLFLALGAEEYKAYTQYGFPHMYATYAGMLPKSRLAYIARPLFINRAGNSSGFDWYKYYSIGTALIFDKLQFLGYARSAVSRAKNAVLLRHVIPNLAQMRKRGEKLSPLFSSMLPLYRGSWLFWLGICPLLFSPDFVFIGALKVWRLTHGKVQ